MREIKEMIKQTHDPNIYDRILRQLKQSVVIVGNGDLNEFPHVTAMYGAPTFLNNNDIVPRSIFEVQKCRFDYFTTRLALIEERIFSHVKDFARPKLTRGQRPSGQTIIHNINSAVGKTQKIWIYGILTQREDTHFYLEDNTYSIKLSFQDLSYADPDAFFTENCILLVQGYYDNG